MGFRLLEKIGHLIPTVGGVLQDVQRLSESLRRLVSAAEMHVAAFGASDELLLFSLIVRARQ